MPPALMAVGLNVLLTRGKLADTVSTSAAEQTTGDVEVIQPAAELVLVTPIGGVMEAVLVICVCATAICGTNWANASTSVSTKKLTARPMDGRKEKIRSKTLESNNESIQI